MLIAIVFAYAAACAVYCSRRCRRDRLEWIYRFTVTFFLPLLGFLYFMMIRMSFGRSKTIDFTGIRSKPQLPEKLPYWALTSQSGSQHVPEAANVIPPEDVLQLDKNAKRMHFLKTLRDKDQLQYGFLKKALVDKDRETAHYAAAAVVEYQGSLLSRLQKASAMAKRQQADRLDKKEYFTALKTYIKSDLADKWARVGLLQEYRVILEQLIEEVPSEKEYYLERISCELELKDYSTARSFCRLFMERFQGHEEPYIMYLKLSYGQKSFTELYYWLERMRASVPQPSGQTQDLLKFWAGV